MSRPYSAFEALGEMAKGAGNFFGQVHAEKVKNERLAQARAAKLEDEQEKRDWQEEQRRLQHAEGLDRIDRQGEVQRENAAHRESLRSDDKSPRTQLVQRDDAVYVVNLDTGESTITDIPAAFDAGNGERTASQETLRMRMLSLDKALDEMDALEASGYDPTGFDGFRDEMTVGSKFTNWMATDEGQQYQAWANQAKEALLRTATGAAAPETENQNYIQMFLPRFGDSPETKAAKKRAMRMHVRNMALASNSDTPQDVANAQLRESMEQSLMTVGLLDDPNSDIPSVPPGLSESAMRYMPQT